MSPLEKLKNTDKQKQPPLPNSNFYFPFWCSLWLAWLGMGAEWQRRPGDGVEGDPDGTTW